MMQKQIQNCNTLHCCHTGHILTEICSVENIVKIAPYIWKFKEVVWSFCLLLWKKFKSQNIHLVHINRINMKYLYEIYKILRITWSLKIQAENYYYPTIFQIPS
jgi:hypothetical protein